MFELELFIDREFLNSSISSFSLPTKLDWLFGVATPVLVAFVFSGASPSS
jgi:hypothetical protein